MADHIAPDGSEIYMIVPPSSHRPGEEVRGLGAVRNASLVEVRLPEGQVSKAVRHKTVEEIWYFLAGAGSVARRTRDGTVQITDVSAGAALTIPTGWGFQFTATDGDLRFLCYTSPPWPGESEAEAVPPLFSDGRGG